MKSIKISVAASKSYLQRALAISALAEGISVLNEVSWCDDSEAARKIIENLGSKISETNRKLSINSKALVFDKLDYNAGEAGLSIRMFSPILALSDKEINFTGEGSLKTRPIDIISNALSQLGVEIKSNKGFLPLKIKGPIQSGNITIDGSLSSQLLTGLLITLPILNGDSIIEVHNLKSIPYIDMTLSIIQDFGVSVENIKNKTFKIKGNQKYKATNYDIEGDWSGGAFFLVYGAIKGKVEVLNLNPNSLQADKAILSALQLAGAKITLKEKSTIVEKEQLNAFNFDATDCPDLFPPLVCLASQCGGISKIKGISRLTHKESDRAKVLQEEFGKIGFDISLKDDNMYVRGGLAKASTINSHNDHRIAMAGGLMNLFCDGEIKIKNKEAVNKSYPNFFKDLEILKN